MTHYYSVGGRNGKCRQCYKQQVEQKMGQTESDIPDVTVASALLWKGLERRGRA